MRRKLFRYLTRKILHVDEGSVLPWHCILIKGFLSPIKTLIWLFQTKSEWFRYDFVSDTFTIYGIKYSARLFEAWAKEGLPIGKRFEIINRDKWNVISIREIGE